MICGICGNAFSITPPKYSQKYCSVKCSKEAKRASMKLCDSKAERMEYHRETSRKHYNKNKKAVLLRQSEYKDGNRGKINNTEKVRRLFGSTKNMTDVNRKAGLVYLSKGDKARISLILKGAVE